MRTRRTASGPFLERPYFSDAEIERLCLDELTRHGLLPTEPAAVRIDRFIEKRFGKSHSYADLPDGVLGLTRFGTAGVEEIVLATSLEDDMSKPSERRLRTTLAHEVGHALLHSHLFALGQQRPLLGDWTDRSAPKVLCREPGLKSHYKGDWWEYQANMVMGTILLPKNLVMKALQPYLEPQGMLQVSVLSESARRSAIRGLSEIFDVNPVVVRARLEKVLPPASGGQMTL
jgi:hypothetical protein